MKSSFERETPEPAFVVELGLHEVRRMLVSFLEEDDHHECFKCNLLRCDCRAPTPRPPTSSSWSELGSSYSSAEDASNNSFELLEVDSIPEEDEEEAAQLRQEITVAFRREQAKDVKEWAKASRYNVVVNGKVQFRLSESINNKDNRRWPPLKRSVWHMPKPTVIPEFTVEPHEIPSPVIPGPLDNIVIDPQIPQYNSREQWSCESEIEEWVRKPWIRQPWSWNPFNSDVIQSQSELKFSLKTHSDNVPTNVSPKSFNTDFPGTRSWASLFRNPLISDGTTTLDPPLVNSPHRIPYSYGNPAHKASKRFRPSTFASAQNLHPYGYWVMSPFPHSLPKPEFSVKAPTYPNQIPQPVPGISNASSSNTLPYWMSPVLSSGFSHLTPPPTSWDSSLAQWVSGPGMSATKVAQSNTQKRTSNNVAAFFRSFAEATASTRLTRRLT